jgi:BirA family biotin operon repressor/biotin-[acetyl-CoA-carboxylase] ligase
VANLKKRWGREDVHSYGRIDSTNEAAKALAEKGASTGTIVVAREQSAGRGRIGRGWYSPRDAGVYLSMIFHPWDLSHPAPISILAGLGIVQQLDRGFPGLMPRLKWPNDVIAADRKLGGILAEASWGEAAARYLVVGVGINVRQISATAPAKVRDEAVAMDEVLKGKMPLADVADAVIEGLEAHLGDAPAVLAEALLAEVDRYDWLRDRRAVLTLPGDEGESVEGMCVGIAPDGALLFRPDRGALRRVRDGTVEAR